MKPGTVSPTLNRWSIRQIAIYVAISPFILVVVFLGSSLLTQYLTHKPLLAKGRLISMASLIHEYHSQTNAYPDSLHTVFSQIGERVDSNHRKEPYPDPYTGSNKEVREFDGTGGWVFSPDKGVIALNYKPLFFSQPPIIWKKGNDSRSKAQQDTAR